MALKTLKAFTGSSKIARKIAQKKPPKWLQTAKSLLNHTPAVQQRLGCSFFHCLVASVRRLRPLSGDRRKSVP